MPAASVSWHARLYSAYPITRMVVVGNACAAGSVRPRPFLTTGSSSALLHATRCGVAWRAGRSIARPPKDSSATTPPPRRSSATAAVACGLMLVHLLRVLSWSSTVAPLCRISAAGMPALDRRDPVESCPQRSECVVAGAMVARAYRGRHRRLQCTAHST